MYGSRQRQVMEVKGILMRYTAAFQGTHQNVIAFTIIGPVPEARIQNAPKRHTRHCDAKYMCTRFIELGRFVVRVKYTATARHDFGDSPLLSWVFSRMNEEKRCQESRIKQIFGLGCSDRISFGTAV